MHSFIFIMYYINQAKSWTVPNLKKVSIMNIMENLMEIVTHRNLSP